MTVKALKDGIYKGKYIEAGESFVLRNQKDFSSFWMKKATRKQAKEKVPMTAPKPQASPVQEPINEPTEDEESTFLDMLVDLSTDELRHLATELGLEESSYKDVSDEELRDLLLAKKSDQEGKES